MTFSQRAVEAALSKFNKVINDPIMEPCPRCEGKGYHHGFGPDGVSPDWCNDCGGNQYNIRPGEEKRAMEAALTAALAVDGVALVPIEPTEAMIHAGHHKIDWCRNDQATHLPEHPSQTDNGVGTTCKQDICDAWSAMLAAASDREERPSPAQKPL